MQTFDRVIAIIIAVMLAANFIRLVTMDRDCARNVPVEKVVTPYVSKMT